MLQLKIIMTYFIHKNYEFYDFLNEIFMKILIKKISYMKE